MTKKLNSEIIQDVRPADEHISYNYTVNKPTWVMFGIVGTNGSRNVLFVTKRMHTTYRRMKNICRLRPASHKLNMY